MGRSNGVPRYPRINYRFMSEDLDFFFQWLVGASTHGGSEAGKTFYAASQIEESDVEGWIRAWTALAERVAARGTTSRDGGHSVSARGSFLRAYTYHRAPLLFISPPDEPGRYRRRHEQARAYFRQAISLFDPPIEPPIEPIDVPFEGATRPGYFVRADERDAPRKTLIMTGGADSHAIGTNLSLMSQVGFDWLDERWEALAPSADRSARPPARMARREESAERA